MNAYSRFLKERRTNSTGFYGIHRSDFEHFNFAEVLIISNLLNVGQSKADSAGWFRASAKFIQLGTGLSMSNQTLALTSLVKRGIVETKISDEGHRMIRIDIEELENVLAGKEPVTSGFGFSKGH